MVVYLKSRIITSNFFPSVLGGGGRSWVFQILYFQSDTYTYIWSNTRRGFDFGSKCLPNPSLDREHKSKFIWKLRGKDCYH